MTPRAAPVDRLLRIEAHLPLGAAHFLMTLSDGEPLPAWDPGQFAMITPGRAAPTFDPLLRRPFSIFNLHGAPAGRTDAIQILYKVLGRGTELLSRAREGDAIRCLAPLGNGFDPERPAGARLLLVAGGIGSASLHPLALKERSAGRSPLVLYGCRTSADLAGIEATLSSGVEVRVATDDGSSGHHGFVSDLLDRFLATQGTEAPRRFLICACGPTPMMKATASVADRHDVRCYLSLESPMACGFGVCVGCVVGTREAPGASIHFRRICVDGPVFDAGRICW